MEKYIINEKTLAIIYKNEKCSQIVEIYNTFNIELSTYDIVNESCLFYGSSLSGRIQSTFRNIGVKYKAPIIISEKRKIVFFPTLSFHKKECNWINLLSIENYSSNKDGGLTIKFINNKVYKINITRNVFNNQILKASRLDSLLKSKNR